jgi:hypothetical protein
MEQSFFWVFLIIALVAGLSLGFSVNNAVITGQASSSRNWRIFDSDNGLNPEIQGFCQDINDGYIDTCMDDMTLIEYMYNEQIGCYPVHYNCGQAGYEGCREGACFIGQHSWYD